MTLVETGTRALAGAVSGPPADGEATWARRLLHLLDETMLVLMDRGFDGGEFLAGVAATGAQFLVRLTSTRRPPVLHHLADGSCCRHRRGAGAGHHRQRRRSPAPTALATAAATGWPPPWPITAATRRPR